jgi:putative copper export protein/mono/diheme cytochrome c family protein/peroxiredoxin
MRLFLLVALWVHLAASVLLTGACFILLLAGPSEPPTARRWGLAVAAYSRLLLLVALGSGIAWLLARTAVFEGRPEAALEPRAVWRALLDTRPGIIWLARHGLLVVLGVFLPLPADTRATKNWFAARGEALALAMLALALVSGSSHAAGVTPRTVLALVVDVAHLLGSGLWIGGLIPLALLLRAASQEAGADSRSYAVLAVRRFSGAALATMFVLITSGALNAVAQIESIAGLVGTLYGHLLLGKLSGLVLILVVAAVNRVRLLPALSGPSARAGCPALGRLAAFVALEAILALVLLLLVAAMTLTTPARHEQPVWPFPFRFSVDKLLDGPVARWQVLLGAHLVLIGAIVAIASRFVRRRRAPMLAGALVLIAVGAGVGLGPIVVDAYPTTYLRPPVTYHAASITSGMLVYREHCATCHGATGAREPLSGQGQRSLVDLRSPPASRRPAGEIFWLITHGIPARGMPGFEGRLAEAECWDVITFIRALGAAAEAGRVGRAVEPERPGLVAPDFVISMGPLTPGALRDYRGRRIVLLVLYTLPGSRSRMAQLARSYDLLWVMGVEVIGVPTDASSEALRTIGASPPVLFPVVTDGAVDIVQTYRMFAPGPHAELLIDRQGYIRAIWKGDTGEMPEATVLLSQVEQLNEEKSAAPFPDEHIH